MKDLKPIIVSLLRAKMAPLLLILQIAVTFTVLVNSVYLMAEKHADITAPTGLSEDVLFSFQIPHRGEEQSQKIANMYRDLESIRALESVAQVSIINSMPLSNRGGGFDIRLDPDEPGYVTKAAIYTGSFDLIDTMGAKLIAGEGFDLVDEDARRDFGLGRVTGVIITKALAQSLFPEDWHQALGSTIYLHQTPHTIRGVVEYLAGPWSFWQHKKNNMIFPTIFLMTDITFLVKAHEGLREQSMKDVVELLMQDPHRQIDELKSITEFKEEAYQAQNAAYTTLQAVIVGLVLITMLGVFGQTRFSVLKRRKHIGTRRALGASRGEIIRYFTLENLLLTSCGVFIGTLLTILANNLLVIHLDLSPVPFVYLIYGCAVVIASGFIAVIQPALKAANISPAEATRTV
ncbi:ABC transporter permease [Pseudoalteromonas luteoviolacea]|uniref:ABC transporter permease n=1 Tax=Pseudoalteromonas luteoviolacea TaxID=43657 RepID=UPI001F224222|nr:FtsX-like permease family protein [Pseudoalteromonas luteoviolacea]MCF6438183.1 ABC transporter permease [Pseudoalteromonas luteoviolacea]